VDAALPFGDVRIGPGLLKRGRPPAASVSRRTALAGGLAALAAGPAAAKAASPRTITIRDDRPGRPISPLIYGCNEIGAMDGGPLSADLDRGAGVTARRLGGNLMTTYDWATNASNAGKDWMQANGFFLPDALKLDEATRREPFAVVDAMHRATLAMGARSLVAVPLAGFVAADADGEVAARDAAPSARFKPVRWTGATPAGAPIDPTVCDAPQLLARLVERYGGAGSEEGIYAYSLDNEPGLWAETHPRIVRAKPAIAALMERSVAAARVVKAIDPQAQVFGPASWGPTEFATFQDAPDWPAHWRFGSFLGAYLDGFRRASEQAGVRLLDVLDVHWYPYSRRGDLFRTEDPSLASALLDAPRSLSEAGFSEDSWVPRALPVVSGGEGVTLPLLPSLQRLVDRWFPGTKIAVTEFNYGGAGAVASGLALADALGRFGAEKVHFASHWGSLAGFLGEAYRIYRAPDAAGGRFGDRSIGLEGAGGPGLAAYAAGAAAEEVPLRLVVVNKTEAPLPVDLGFASGRTLKPLAVIGFDASQPMASAVDERPEPVDGGWRIVLPPRSARRYAFG
jgi:mannan endo-1,4-beta-mannosidase